MDKHHVSKRKYVNIIITLLSVAVMPLYLYGTRVLTLLIVSLVTAVVTDFICMKFIARKEYAKHDYSFIITGLIVALLLPATAPIFIAVVATSIAIIVAKHPFGGEGYNTFNPAAVGVAFVAICWPEFVLRYPVPFTTKNVVSESLIQYVSSPSSILRVGGTPKIDYFDVLLGRFVGPMGTTCMIVLGCCLLYLVLRKAVSLRIVLSTLFVVAVTAVLAPRVVTGALSSIVYEFSAGALIFGVIFMANDPVTIPKTKSGQILYGLILGLSVVMFRHFGNVELEFVYALLIANVFAIPCDKYAFKIKDKLDVWFPDDKQGKTSKKALSTTESVKEA